MAHKALTDYAKEHGLDLKVEVQSAMGVDNKLSRQDIAEADVVIFAVDIAVRDRERFEAKKVLKVLPGEAIKHTAELFKKADALVHPES